MELEPGSGLVKIIKTRSYFSRYQVKYKRRRQCKTDYYARKRLILQDKNKYGTPKYRYVVRFSNKDISCQIFSAGLTHDSCLAAAYSHELKRYGVKLGLTNYAAAYCTGLLLARRLNTKLKLDYEGNTEELGEYYEVEANEEGSAPFCALLDVGLKPASTGSRLFGALKGACDGGVDIPHGDRRFPRPKSDANGKDYEPDAEFHRKYIFGGHVAEYMTKLKDDDEEAFKKQFSKFIAEGIEPEDLEGIYEAAHKEIRANPFKERGELERGRFKTRETPVSKTFVYPKQNWPCHPRKKTIAQKKDAVRKKLVAMGKTKVFRNPNDLIANKKAEKQAKKRKIINKQNKRIHLEKNAKRTKLERKKKGLRGPLPRKRGIKVRFIRNKECLAYGKTKKKGSKKKKGRKNVKKEKEEEEE